MRKLLILCFVFSLNNCTGILADLDEQQSALSFDLNTSALNTLAPDACSEEIIIGLSNVTGAETNIDTTEFLSIEIDDTANDTVQIFAAEDSSCTTALSETDNVVNLSPGATSFRVKVSDPNDIYFYVKSLARSSTSLIQSLAVDFPAGLRLVDYNRLDLQRIPYDATTAYTLNRPDKIKEGQLLIVRIGGGTWIDTYGLSTRSVSPPAGWTTLENRQNTTWAMMHAGDFFAYYKFATDDEPLTYTFNFTHNNSCDGFGNCDYSDIYFSIESYHGIHPSSPIQTSQLRMGGALVSGPANLTIANTLQMVTGWHQFSGGGAVTFNAPAAFPGTVTSFLHASGIWWGLLASNPIVTGGLGANNWYTGTAGQRIDHNILLNPK